MPQPVNIAKPSEQHHSMIERLIETNIVTQNKMADLLVATKELNTNVSKLVHMFTEAATHIKAGKYEDPLVERLNELLEQNKNLAKGLLMLEEYVRKKQAPPQFIHPSSEF